MTAYQLLFQVGACQAGEAVLIHAAASSIGQAAIQLALRKGIYLVIYYILIGLIFVFLSIMNFGLIFVFLSIMN